MTVHKHDRNYIARVRHVENVAEYYSSRDPRTPERLKKQRDLHQRYIRDHLTAAKENRKEEADAGNDSDHRPR